MMTEAGSDLALADVQVPGEYFDVLSCLTRAPIASEHQVSGRHNCSMPGQCNAHVAVDAECHLCLQQLWACSTDHQKKGKRTHVYTRTLDALP